ncbi:MAG: HAMP domain-containing protein [Planctomycetes bacterium]|nr:HAMP domain-containing protein [Planctomycetota bacterium]
MNIRNKLVFIFAGFSIIPVAIFGFIAIRDSRSTLTEQIGASSLEYAQLSMQRINEYLYSKCLEMQRWAKDRSMKNVVNNDKNGRISRYIVNVANNYDEYYFISCLNNEGKIIASSDAALIGKDCSADNSFRQTMEGKGAFCIRDIEYDTRMGGYALIISVPIKDTTMQSKTIGVLSAALKWEMVNKKISGLKIAGKTQDEANHVNLTNKEGLVISCYAKDKMFSANMVKLGMKSAKYAREGKEGYLLEKTEHGLLSLSAYTHLKNYKDLPQPDWYLVLYQDPERIFYSVYSLKKTMIYIMVFTSFIFVIISVAVANRISKPILKIALKARAIGKGDLKARMPVLSKDEIGALAVSFNKMADDLQEYNEALMKSKMFIENIFNCMADCLLVISPDGIIEMSNQAAQKLLGYGKSVLEGKPIAVVLGGSEINFTKRDNSTEFKNYETYLKPKEGNLIPALISAAPMRDKDNNLISTICVATDITGYKRMKEQVKKSEQQLYLSEKMSALGIMAAGVAHELNNPMMGILNYAQYCLRYADKEDKRYAVLKDLEKETKRCIDIVKSLLSFSRTEDASNEAYKKVNCTELIDRVVRLFSYRFDNENAKIIRNYERELPEIWAKPNRMQQVFSNIIGNSLDAVKESEKKEITVSVRLQERCVLISIQDTGSGISPEHMEKIFDPFFTLKPAGRGTGLGLSISQGIVKEHKGDITCSSRPGEGTIFNILLPIEKSGNGDQ